MRTSKGTNTAFLSRSLAADRKGARGSATRESARQAADAAFRGADDVQRGSLEPEVLRKRSLEVEDSRVRSGDGATSQKDCSQRTDDGESEYDDGSRKMPL